MGPAGQWLLDALGLTLVALYGLAVGSFLNVVIWRVPRGESVVRPPSACPGCGHPIRARDNIPVLGWLVLRGRCRDCDAPISARYPAVELLTAVILILVALRIGWVWELPAFLVLMAGCVALAFIDLDTRRLPDVIVGPLLVAGLVLLGFAAALTGSGAALGRAVLGALALFAFYLVLWVAKPGGMGLGDVKLAPVLGLHLAWLGWGSLVVGAFSAFLVGGLYAIGLLVAGRAGRKSAVPFGPWMVLGALVGILAGEQVWGWYTGLIFGTASG